MGPESRRTGAAFPGPTFRRQRIPRCTTTAASRRRCTSPPRADAPGKVSGRSSRRSLKPMMDELNSLDARADDVLSTLESIPWF